MIGLFVGFVGKPTPMSGVDKDLSTGVEEDIVGTERLSEILKSYVG